MNPTRDVGDRISASPAAMAEDCAQWLCDRALDSKGRFAVCCSGGSTPRGMYERLAGASIASRFPWDRVHWFWGDERFVPHDHPDSNFGMVEAALFSRTPVPPANIHAVLTTGLSVDEAAMAYERTLKTYLGRNTLSAEQPIFDVMLLGLGTDGHTASLFPHHPALDETRRWAIAVEDQQPESRITLTYPVLANARNTVFLVTGCDKRSIVTRVKAHDETLPASRLTRARQLHWFMDNAAAPDNQRP